VSRYLRESGVNYELRVLDQSTRTSALAAQALGCTISEIAKSVVFVGSSTAVVIISGDRRVDLDKLGRTVGGPVRAGNPVEVEASTGYRIGGVPPFPHKKGVRVLLDKSIGRHAHVWAAAGAPNAVFRISSGDLTRLVGGDLYDLSA
jgi:prolyl-tRNA editing enzyme YbaK/EbsC (Cys-tRNA(Pro) deacylase)